MQPHQVHPTTPFKKKKTKYLKIHANELLLLIFVTIIKSLIV
jgi:hypothetical protein